MFYTIYQVATGTTFQSNKSSSIGFGCIIQPSNVEAVQYAVGSFQEEATSDAGLRLLPFEGVEMSPGGVSSYV